MAGHGQLLFQQVDGLSGNAERCPATPQNAPKKRTAGAESFMAAHGLPDVTIVADVGMVSEANQKDSEAAGSGT